MTKYLQLVNLDDGYEERNTKTGINQITPINTYDMTKKNKEITLFPIVWSLKINKPKY